MSCKYLIMRRGILFFVLLVCLVQVRSQSIGTYTSVNPVGQGTIFELPPTHRFQKIVQMGDTLTAGGTMPLNHDFTGYVPIGGSSELGYLAVNSEVIPGGVTVFDLEFNATTRLWQVLASEAVDFSYFAANGAVPTARNCSGAVTPWGTVVSSEEHESTVDVNGDGYNDSGWNVEIDPATRTVIDQDGNGDPDKMWALGCFRHENVVVAADQRTVYQGEDKLNQGFVFKFVCDSATKFVSGDHFVLQVNGTTGSWIQIPNTTQDDRDSTLQLAEAAGGTKLLRVEDVDIGPDGKVYVASTQSSRIYRFTDNGATISDFEVFVENQMMPITHATGVDSAMFRNPDNLAFDCEGNLWVTQDGAGAFIWMVRPTHTNASPDIEVFANTPRFSEPTGITFSPDCRFMFLSLQHPDTTNSDVDIDVAGNMVVYNRDITMVVARQEALGMYAGGAESPAPGPQLLALYPNPVQHTLNLRVEHHLWAEATVSVFGMDGSLHLQGTQRLHSGSNDWSVSVEGLSAGTYLLELRTSQGRVVKQFVKAF